MSPKLHHTLKNLFRIFLILFGNALYSLAVVAFILPSGIITGGTTGLALASAHWFHTPITAFVLCFNILTFLLGFFVLGWKFAATTLLSTFLYPILLAFWQQFPALSSLTKDAMLCTILGGMMIGAGIGIVIRAGASTGGMDIPPLILKKLFHLPVSATLYVFDFSILILQMFFSDIEESLYGILLVMIYTFVLDKVLVIGTHQALAGIAVITERRGGRRGFGRYGSIDGKRLYIAPEAGKNVLANAVVAIGNADQFAQTLLDFGGNGFPV